MSSDCRHDARKKRGPTAVPPQNIHTVTTNTTFCLACPTKRPTRPFRPHGADTKAATPRPKPPAVGPPVLVPGRPPRRVRRPPPPGPGLADAVAGVGHPLGAPRVATLVGGRKVRGPLVAGVAVVALDTTRLPRRAPVPDMETLALAVAPGPVRVAVDDTPPRGVPRRAARPVPRPVDTRPTGQGPKGPMGQAPVRPLGRVAPDPASPFEITQPIGPRRLYMGGHVARPSPPVPPPLAAAVGEDVTQAPRPPRPSRLAVDPSPSATFPADGREVRLPLVACRTPVVPVPLGGTPLARRAGRARTRLPTRRRGVAVPRRPPDAVPVRAPVPPVPTVTPRPGPRTCPPLAVAQGDGLGVGRRPPGPVVVVGQPALVAMRPAGVRPVLGPARPRPVTLAPPVVVTGAPPDTVHVDTARTLAAPEMVPDVPRLHARDGQAGRRPNAGPLRLATALGGGLPSRRGPTPPVVRGGPANTRLVHRPVGKAVMGLDEEVAGAQADKRERPPVGLRLPLVDTGEPTNTPPT